jgi:hypothetical protein
LKTDFTSLKEDALHRLEDCGSPGMPAPVSVNPRTMGWRVFRVLRETISAVAMIADPDQVRRTLGAFEKESKGGSVVHD